MADDLLLVKRGEGCWCDVLSDVYGDPPRLQMHYSGSRCSHGSTVETIPLSRLLPEGLELVECEECVGLGREEWGEHSRPCAYCLGTGYRVRPAAKEPTDALR